MVFHNSSLVFLGSMLVFHGSRLVFFLLAELGGRPPSPFMEKICLVVFLGFPSLRACHFIFSFFFKRTFFHYTRLPLSLFQENFLFRRILFLGRPFFGEPCFQGKSFLVEPFFSFRTYHCPFFYLKKLFIRINFSSGEFFFRRTFF